MAQGTVKWFNESKGFGFSLRRHRWQGDLFGHFSQDSKVPGFKEPARRSGAWNSWSPGNKGGPPPQATADPSDSEAFSRNCAEVSRFGRK